jgi:hypothetical protein
LFNNKYLGWGMEDYLGKAAHEKQSAKIAIKRKKV